MKKPEVENKHMCPGNIILSYSEYGLLFLITCRPKTVFLLCRYTLPRRCTLHGIRYLKPWFYPTHNITVSKLYYLLCGVPSIAYIIIPNSLIKHRIILYFMYKCVPLYSCFQVNRNNIVGIKRNRSLRPKQAYFRQSRSVSVILLTFKLFLKSY